jgi:hypothetical protein
MKKETTGWFEREVVVADAAFPEVASAFKVSLAKQGFKIRDESSSAAELTVRAMFGSQWRAFVVSFIPYIGRHLPSGKRLFLTATVFQNCTGVTVKLSITPYMELLDCEEIMPVSQTADEKITDEYLAALKLFQLIQTLFSTIGREVPPEFQKLDVKPFAKDAFWRFLLYPLDGFKSRKPVFIPSESGPIWCWGGFIMPEIWFLWHEIWGASIVAVIAEFLTARLLVPLIGFHGVWIGIGIVRILGGIFGHRIYYCRYGAWLGASPNQRQGRPEAGQP